MKVIAVTPIITLPIFMIIFSVFRSITVFNFLSKVNNFSFFKIAISCFAVISIIKTAPIPHYNDKIAKGKTSKNNLVAAPKGSLT